MSGSAEPLARAEELSLRSFTACFDRQQEGVWRCVKHGTLELPNGKKIEIAPGTVLTIGSSFMGCDVAQMLEDHYNLDPGAR